MKKTKCYSVRLESLVRISPKAFKATAFDGSSDIIPASQVFGRDFEVEKIGGVVDCSLAAGEEEFNLQPQKTSFFQNAC